MCYVYTLTHDGVPRERKGHIIRRNGNFFVVEIGYQRICLPSKPTTIHNDAMWCTVSQKNVYIEKMLDILLQRRQRHIDAIQSLDRRISRLKEGFET